MQYLLTPEEYDALKNTRLSQLELHAYRRQMEEERKQFAHQLLQIMRLEPGHDPLEVANLVKRFCEKADALGVAMAERERKACS